MAMSEPSPRFSCQDKTKHAATVRAAETAQAMPTVSGNGRLAGCSHIAASAERAAVHDTHMDIVRKARSAARLQRGEGGKCRERVCVCVREREREREGERKCRRGE